jgi:CelD/BcsL family acetyltransferase involved in cellulose biosynthesis
VPISGSGSTTLSRGHGSVLTISDALQAFHRIDPLSDPRWIELVANHPRASVFHTRGWLEALWKTYRYRPAAYTTSPPRASLRNAVVFCTVDSWLSGRRLVSLPFSDHCELLADDLADATVLFLALEHEFRQHKNRYFEIRPTSPLEVTTDLYSTSEELYLHKVDLRPDLDTIFHRFHKSSTQRKVHRAEREKLTYQEGRSDSLLKSFYELTVLTRRRHGVPPQPFKWFRNLLDCLGASATIMAAYKDGRPLASIFTLRHRDTLTYKYGCSDPRFHNLGGIQMLFWRAMQDAKRDGFETFDLGRSSVLNEGLIRFKERWGAERSSLLYKTFSAVALPRRGLPYSETNWKVRCAKHFFSHAPSTVLSLAGQALYRHIG